MPRIKSSIKDVRRTKRRRAANRAGLSALKTAIRRARLSPADQRAAALKSAFQVIDKASRTGLIHRNAGARYKSRLTKAAAKPA
jgi:small subunit ribosomal protein S20